MESPRSILSVGRLAIVFVLAVGTWYATNRRNLAELGEAYRERGEFQQRLAGLGRQIVALDYKRRELARGGFPAEQSLREVHLYARPEEFVTRIETSDAAAEPPADDSR